MTPTGKSERLELVDALRGYAILSIILLHNLEHLNIYYFPDYLPGWLKHFDGRVWNSLFFVVGGKSYQMFALLFGLTFFLQSARCEQRGEDFRGRFLWRLLLLFGFGVFNAMFYDGDILTLFAVLGISLVFVSKLGNKTVLVIAVLLMLQPLEWLRLIEMVGNPSYRAPASLSGMYYSKVTPFVTGTSLPGLINADIRYGWLGDVTWSWEHGRFFQAPELFMLGMLAGRKGLFGASQASARFWKQALIFSVALFVFLYFPIGKLIGTCTRPEVAGKLSFIVSTWQDFALMAVEASLFVFLYRQGFARGILRSLQPFGRMSLTNYISLSIIGTFVYDGYGLGLYKYTGASFSLLIGCGLFLFQLWFCRWWLQSHTQGPLEFMWHEATWIGSKNRASAKTITTR
jgi:uncharacterized protein